MGNPEECGCRARRSGARLPEKAPPPPPGPPRPAPPAPPGTPAPAREEPSPSLSRFCPFCLSLNHFLKFYFLGSSSFLLLFLFRESPFLLYLFLLISILFVSYSMPSFIWIETSILYFLALSRTHVLCLCVRVPISWWLFVCASGHGSPGLAQRVGAGFSTVFGEGWEEGTWDVGSLFRPSSPHTHTHTSVHTHECADRSRQGEDWGSPERPAFRRNGGSSRPPGVQHYFLPSLVQSFKGIPDPRTGSLPWDPDGKWAGSPGPLPYSPWDGLRGKRRRLTQDKAFQVAGCRPGSCKDGEGSAGKLSLESWKPSFCTGLCH